MIDVDQSVYYVYAFHFSADVKKPASFESGFLVFGAWRCRRAHSGSESHSKWDIIIASGRPYAVLVIELFCLNAGLGMSLGYLLTP